MAGVVHCMYMYVPVRVHVCTWSVKHDHSWVMHCVRSSEVIGEMNYCTQLHETYVFFFF